MRQRIEAFLRQAEAFVSRYPAMERLIDESEQSLDAWERQSGWLDRLRKNARRELLAVGHELAPLLEAAGEDCSALLLFLHAADGGGGPSAALPLWAPLKVALQRLAVREQLSPAPGGRKAPKAKRDKPPTEAERRHEQRNKFSRPRRRKGESWLTIYADYHTELLRKGTKLRKDNKASPGALRHSFQRHGGDDSAE